MKISQLYDFSPAKLSDPFILEQISNATVFNFKYFSSDISYQAYFLCVSVGGYEILNSCHVTSSDEISSNLVI